MSDLQSLYEDVDQLKKAMTGKTDEETLIKVTAKNNLKQRLKIISQYKIKCGTDLLDDLKSHISGYFLDLMIGLYMNKYEYDAEQCHKSIEGLGTNEDTLIEILGTRPGWMLKKIMKEYKKKYNAELKDEIIGDTSGDFQELLLLLLKCNRSENKNPNKEKCKQIAIEMFNKDEKKLIQNNPDIYPGLAPRKALQDYYEKCMYQLPTSEEVYKINPVFKAKHAEILKKQIDDKKKRENDYIIKTKTAEYIANKQFNSFKFI